ncbi:hypothetical protein Q31b_16290 [Novipirellula aureliae]|uniref:Type II secretion system protein G n=1 Tax=Novipirellula aureliae TaxID=2527966 RepID=A0A5C6E677_9BACT|nr:prepilin-type N-terminal cleavage/methylation domain-containing protein [Novipirellula aureliae]TWU44094.1 hypothetical protein Q31b_16290 [Novipirellula aureliae]
MKRIKTSGFSLLEVIAAVIILAVVAAATVATVAPTHQKNTDNLAEREVATLNSMAQTYFHEVGTYPRNVNDLVTQNYLNNVTTADKARIKSIVQNYTYHRATGEFTKK